MSIPRMTLDSRGYAYIYLAEPRPDAGGGCVPLESGDLKIDALDSLVLDFDGDGRLVGIEVLEHARTVLRPELLATAEILE